MAITSSSNDASITPVVKTTTAENTAVGGDKHQSKAGTNAGEAHDKFVSEYTESKLKLIDVPPALDPGREPTKDALEHAQKEFDKNVKDSEGLASDKDKKLLKDMGHAVLSGDPKALGEAFEKIKNDPELNGDPEKVREKQEAFAQELSKNLSDIGANARVKVSEDGHVLLYDTEISKAVAIDPATRKLGERRIQVDPDGTVTVLPGEVLGKPAELAKEIGNAAVNRDSSGLDVSSILDLIRHPPADFPWLRPDPALREPQIPWNSPLYPIFYPNDPDIVRPIKEPLRPHDFPEPRYSPLDPGDISPTIHPQPKTPWDLVYYQEPKPKHLNYGDNDMEVLDQMRKKYLLE